MRCLLAAILFVAQFGWAAEAPGSQLPAAHAAMVDAAETDPGNQSNSMNDDPQNHWLDKPLNRGLAIVAGITVLFGFVVFVWDYQNIKFRQLPELKGRVDTLTTDLGDARRERDDLRRSVENTDALLEAIASVPGEIRQITRNVFISYDEASPSLITQVVDGQQFQWRISVRREEDGTYAGMVGHRLFGSSMGIDDSEHDEKAREMFAQMRSGIDKMGLFINAADRIDLSSRKPQQIANAKSISSMHPPPENGLEIYLIIERNEDQMRRWRCALIATMQK